MLQRVMFNKLELRFHLTRWSESNTHQCSYFSFIAVQIITPHTARNRPSNLQQSFSSHSLLIQHVEKSTPKSMHTQEQPTCIPHSQTRCIQFTRLERTSHIQNHKVTLKTAQSAAWPWMESVGLWGCQDRTQALPPPLPQWPRPLVAHPTPPCFELADVPAALPWTE